MESFLTELKKDVQCSLCNDTLTEPKIVRCFHTFCKPCIKRHAELIDDGNVFKCPKCNSATLLPELNSVEDLKPNLVHSRILEGLSLVEGTVVCSVSESHSQASLYCFDCDRSMCDDCENNHSLFTKGHMIVRLADLKKEDLELIISRENHCENHPNQRLELFCENCEAVICLTCLKDKHKGHVASSLHEFASRKKIVLSKHLKVIENLMSNDKERQEHEEISSNIKKQGEKALKEIKEKTQKMIETLQENEEKLLKQVMENLEKAERNLNIIHNMPAVKEYIDTVMERGLASEMVNITEKECSEEYVLNPISRYLRISFVQNEALMQKIEIGLGEIQFRSKTDHTMSTVEVNSEPEALNEAKLTVTTKTSSGELGYDSLDVVDVTISPENNLVMGKTSVVTDGKIEVEFIPKVAGQLTAEVQVNGNHVSNSPLVMNVQPQKMRRTTKFKMKGLRTLPNTVNGVAVNKENSRIAVADESANCVHVFNTNGDRLLNFGSQGSAQERLRGPESLAFLDDTDLIIADSENDRICIFNTLTGELLKTFGSNGNGDGEFSGPNGVHVDEDENIIVCDTNNQRVQVFTRDGHYQYQFGLNEEDNFSPVGVTTYDGLFFVSDRENHSIRVFEKHNGIPTRVLTIGEEGSADGQLNTPWGIAVDKNHHLLVCDFGNNRIQRFTLDGRFVGKTRNKVDGPVYIAIMSDGQVLISTYGYGVYYLE